MDPAHHEHLTADLDELILSMLLDEGEPDLILDGNAYLSYEVLIPS